MEKIKMVALDLDGTTFNEESKITAETEDALVQAMKQGVHVVVSTGRSFDSVPEQVFHVDGLEYIITSNGADIKEIKTEKTIYENHISSEGVELVLDAIKEADLSLEAVVKGITYMDKEEFDRIASRGSDFREVEYVLATRTPITDLRGFMKENSSIIENINLVFRTLDDKARWRKVLEKLPGITVTTSFTNNLEVGGQTTSKAEALKFLLNKLNVTREELMACGDSPNDREMIKFAGLGVAMENAADEVKEVSQYVTASNKENGVAKAIKKFVLNK